MFIINRHLYISNPPLPFSLAFECTSILIIQGHLISRSVFLFFNSSLTLYILTAVSPFFTPPCPSLFPPLSAISTPLFFLHKRAGFSVITTEHNIGRCNKTMHRLSYQGLMRQPSRSKESEK